MQVLRKRIIDAWMDTLHADTAKNPESQVALQAENAQMQVDGVAMQQQVVMAGVQLVPIILFTVEK